MTRETGRGEDQMRMTWDRLERRSVLCLGSFCVLESGVFFKFLSREAFSLDFS